MSGTDNTEDRQMPLFDKQPVPQPDPDDFELPPKACDLDRPEGCESCQ
jgi:hypothetical protein